MITSSVASGIPLPGAVNYAATKTFVSYLAQGLNYELKDKKIDVLDWKPGEVATKMLEKEARGDVVSTETAVKGMFRDLGKEVWSNGATRHSFMFWQFMTLVPASVVNSMLWKQFNQVHKE